VVGSGAGNTESCWIERAAYDLALDEPALVRPDLALRRRRVQVWARCRRPRPVERRFELIDLSLHSAVGAGISAGLAALAAGETLDEVLARTDAALLDAKGSAARTSRGGHRVRWPAPDLGATCKRDLTSGQCQGTFPSMQNDVRELRTVMALRQEDLAKAMKVSRQTINAIETGRYLPSLPLAIALARFFRKPVEDLFHGDDDDGR
jgi:putative transcriptional regulator